MSNVKIYKLYQLNATQSKIVRAVIEKTIDLIDNGLYHRKTISKRVIKNIELEIFAGEWLPNNKVYINFQYDQINITIELTNNEISKLLNGRYNKGKCVDELIISILNASALIFPTHHHTMFPRNNVYLKADISGNVTIENNNN